MKYVRLLIVVILYLIVSSLQGAQLQGLMVNPDGTVARPPNFWTANQAALISQVTGQSILRGSNTVGVNVQDYGADPTGVLDSTPAMRNAIDAIQLAGGGRLAFPAGTYKVHTFDQMTGGSDPYYIGIKRTLTKPLEFYGIGDVTLVQDALAPAPSGGHYSNTEMFQFEGSSPAIKFTGIKFLSTHSSSPVSASTAINFSATTYITNVSVQDCEFRNFQIAMWVSGVKGFRALRCNWSYDRGHDEADTTGVPSVGIRFWYTTTDVEIGNCVWDGCALTDYASSTSKSAMDGFLWGYATGFNIHDNIIRHNEVEGILLLERNEVVSPPNQQSHPTASIIRDNSIEYPKITGQRPIAGFIGIRYADCNGIIRGNIIKDQRYGIDVAPQTAGFTRTNLIITGNLIQCIPLTSVETIAQPIPNQSVGIVAQYCCNLLIADNQIIWPSRRSVSSVAQYFPSYGIRLIGCYNATVNGNRITSMYKYNDAGMVNTFDIWGVSINTTTNLFFARNFIQGTDAAVVREPVSAASDSPNVVFDTQAISGVRNQYIIGQELYSPNTFQYWTTNQF